MINFPKDVKRRKQRLNTFPQPTELEIRQPPQSGWLSGRLPLSFAVEISNSELVMTRAHDAGKRSAGVNTTTLHGKTSAKELVQFSFGPFFQWGFHSEKTPKIVLTVVRRLAVGLFGISIHTVWCPFSMLHTPYSNPQPLAPRPDYHIAVLHPRQSILSKDLLVQACFLSFDGFTSVDGVKRQARPLPSSEVNREKRCWCLQGCKSPPAIESCGMIGKNEKLPLCHYLARMMQKLRCSPRVRTVLVI